MGTIIVSLLSIMLRGRPLTRLIHCASGLELALTEASAGQGSGGNGALSAIATYRSLAFMSNSCMSLKSADTGAPVEYCGPALRRVERNSSNL